MDAKVRILNLEDNCEDSELIRSRLKAEGVECELLRVDTETDYQRALEQGGFDLIIADFSISSFNGSRGLELARRHQPEIPLLVFSGSLDEEAAIKNLKNGAVDYILKERPARLVAAVRRALREADVQRQRKRAEKARCESEAQLRLMTETIAEAQDITERRQAEQALLESEENYRQIVELAMEGVWVIDAGSRTTFVSRRMAEMIGYSVAEMIGKSLLEFMGDGPQPAAENSVERCRRGMRDLVELTLQTKDGKDVPVLFSTAPLPRKEGQYVGALALVSDITDRKTLEEQFRQAQKMEAVGRLAGGVAHDFNNLLMVISGYSGQLIKELDVRDPMRGQVIEINKAGQRAAELTQQLLAFSRKQTTQPKILDLNRVVRDVEKMLRRLIGEDIELVTVLNPELGTVMADPGQMSQVLMNLAVNSRDAMPNGGRLMIETSNIDLDDTYTKEQPEIRPGPYVQLTVGDSGTGMDAETRAHLFEPFFTTKKAGEGTGLGLPIVYGVVRQAGGFIWVNSTPGEGTAFKIYLPKVEEAVEAEEAMKPAAGTLSGTETILVVEDQPELRKLAQTVLRRLGYKVLDAANPAEALLHSGRYAGPIHLMLTDVVMPGMNGRELADRLKLLRPEMKVVYMSGYTGSAFSDREVSEAGVNYLQKPVSPDALAVKLREVLGPILPAVLSCGA